MIMNDELRVLDQTAESLPPVMRINMGMHGKFPHVDFSWAFRTLHRHLGAYCRGPGAARFDVKPLVSVAVHRTFTAGRKYFAGTRATAVPQAHCARLAQMPTIPAHTGIDLLFQNMRGDVDTKFIRVDRLLALRALSFIRIADRRNTAICLCDFATYRFLVLIGVWQSPRQRYFRKMCNTKFVLFPNQIAHRA